MEKEVSLIVTNEELAAVQIAAFTTAFWKVKSLPVVNVSVRRTASHFQRDYDLSHRSPENVLSPVNKRGKNLLRVLLLLTLVRLSISVIITVPPSETARFVPTAVVPVTLVFFV